jgi:pseudouridine-5'-phosphate glycosidase
VAPLLDVSPEISAALAAGRAVVALESTLITHGLPYPVNVETALGMEAAVRESGAIPATIAVIRGRLVVGISAAEIERLSRLPAGTVRKCSRRDLPIAVARGEDAATTVAGTLIIAHRAGIRVFATGGIGGVHRGQPFDVSADLIELGRTPVAVVCSGAKSILDLPATVEVLETQGVPVIGLGTEDLPGFYTRSTGLPVDCTAASEADAARVVVAAWRLQSGQGLLIAVPAPADVALGESEVERAIAQATAEATAAGVKGKQTTPFLLARVAELTGGRSRAANTALLLNNARVAGRLAIAVAAHLSHGH